MGNFWNTLTAEMDDDDGADKVNGKIGYEGSTIGFWSATDEISERMNLKQWRVFSKLVTKEVNNLPTESVRETSEKCETCGTIGLLGNGLCVECWGYVVDHSSANAKNWPDTAQFLTIKAKK